MRGGARLVCSMVLLLASPGVASAVIGGTPADPAEWSFVVAILDASTAEPFAAQFCAGSLVAPDRVLTAAHCVDGRDASSVQVATVGTSLSAIAAGDRIAVDRIDVYPLHRPGRAFADVALLHLTRPLATTADLPLGLFYGDGVKLARFAGWGLTDPAGGRHPDALLTAAATILSRTGCASSSIEPGTLCATFPGSGESAVCPGDSGGPLADLVSGRRPRLIGIVSFVPLSGGTGPLCGVGKTTVYTSAGSGRGSSTCSGTAIRRRACPRSPGCAPGISAA